MRRHSIVSIANPLVFWISFNLGLYLSTALQPWLDTPILKRQHSLLFSKRENCLHLHLTLCLFFFFFGHKLCSILYPTSQVALVVKNSPASAGLIPGLARSPGGGHGNLLQYSCLENPMDRGVWWIIVHIVAKSQTWLKQLSTHTLHPTACSTQCSFSHIIAVSEYMVHCIKTKFYTYICVC